MNKNMIYFYCLACFIPSIIILFAMFYNKDFDGLNIVYFVTLFAFGFLFSLAIYLAYFSPVSLEKLEMIMNKTNE